MYLDKFSNPIFNESDIFDYLYSDTIDQLSEITVTSSAEIKNLENISNLRFNQVNELDISLEEYDKIAQSTWFMPDEYKIFDIENWLYQQCNTKIETLRVQEEIIEFKHHNMIDLLRWLKYFVDNCRKNNILWGVGRGSSVSSYILYLIGVHRINSIKYNLDWREFLK